MAKLCWGVLGVAAFSQQPSRHTQVVPGLMSSLQTENRDRPWLRDAPLGPPNLSLGPRSTFTEGCILLPLSQNETFHDFLTCLVV